MTLLCMLINELNHRMNPQGSESVGCHESYLLPNHSNLSLSIYMSIINNSGIVILLTFVQLNLNTRQQGFVKLPTELKQDHRTCKVERIVHEPRLDMWLCYVYAPVVLNKKV